MSFSDLEKQLQKFFLLAGKTPTKSRKARIRLQTLESFERSRRKPVLFPLLGLARTQAGLTSLGLLGVLFVLVGLPLDDKEVVAGVVQPVFGPVEIIRGDKSFLTEDETELLVGDFVNVGAKSQAKISLPNQMTAVADRNTRLKVNDLQHIFLVKGELENTVFRGGEFATNRGVVKSSPGATFTLSVNETGETTVALEKNHVEVFDLGQGSVALQAGDELTLRSDTDLTVIMDEDYTVLSGPQTQSIQAKLIIARSKVLSGLEKQFSGESDVARKDFGSAEQTFLSIAQVLKTPRQQEIARRINLEALDIEEIYPLVADKTKNQELLQEIRAVESLFVILKNNRGNLAFGRIDTDVRAFNRITALRHLYSLGTPQQEVYRDLLIGKYVQNFLNDVYAKRLKIDQISHLNAQISKLPEHEYTRDFLEQVAASSDPYLQQVLGEKILNSY